MHANRLLEIILQDPGNTPPFGDSPSSHAGHKDASTSRCSTKLFSGYRLFVWVVSSLSLLV